MSLTIEQALTVNTIHHNTNKDSHGACQVWHRNGQTQTWKRRPSSFRMPVKHGLYQYGNVTEANAHECHAADECPFKRS